MIPDFETASSRHNVGRFFVEICCGQAKRSGKSTRAPHTQYTSWKVNSEKIRTVNASEVQYV